MIWPEEFTSTDESKVCRLLRSIYGLKQASQSWYLYFDRCIKSYDFVRNEEKQCIHKWVIGSMIVFLVLFVDDVLLIGNKITALQGIRSGCHLKELELQVKEPVFSGPTLLCR